MQTPFGRRWYHFWASDELTAAALAAGFVDVNVERAGVFFNVWASTPTGSR